MLCRVGSLTRRPKCGASKVWYNSSYSYRKELTIPAGAVTADLTDQPVSVLLSGDADLSDHAQPDGSDIVFCGADKTTVLDFVVPRAAKGMLVGDGAWNWCADPRVLRAGDKTYIGVVTSVGYIFAVSYDHVTKEQKCSGTLRASLQDDHDNPVFLELSDGKISVWYQAHNGGAWYRISTNAGDVSAWGTERDWTAANAGLASHAYAHPFRFSNTIKVFFRGGTSVPGVQQWVATTTEANLATNTWTGAAQWLNPGAGVTYPYAKFCSDNSDYVHIAFTQSHPKQYDCDLFYAKYRISTGTWHKADGTQIGSDAALPIALASFEKLYDHATQGRAWIWDIALDGDGNPVVAYSAYPGADNTHAPDCRYRYARYNGTSWDDHEITAGGTGLYADEIFYSGGYAIDRGNTNSVYLSRNNTAAGADVYVLEEWTTADSGATWTSASIATSGKNVRPAFAWGANSGDPLSMVWLNGSYTSMYTYDLSVITSSALGVPRLNWLQDAVVKIPTITAAGGAKAYMYYGNASPSDVSDAAGVWAAAAFAVHGNDYDLGDMVLESKSGTKKQKYKIPTSQEGAGMVGKAQVFANSGQIPLGTLNLAGLRKLSVLTEVKGDNGYIVSNYAGNTKADFYLRVTPATKKLTVWYRDSAGTAVTGTFEGLVFDTTTAHRIGVVFDCDDGGWKAWLDGVQSATVVAAANPFHATASDPMNFGWSAGHGASFTGSLSNTSLYPDVALTEAQIKAFTDSGKTPAAFITRGTEEAR